MPNQCAVCESSVEDIAHIFFLGSKNVIYWQRTGLWSTLMTVFDLDASFSTNVFVILQHLDQQKQVFGVTLWSIWKHRNDMV